MNQPLRYLDITLATPEQNLACEEVLLSACEAGQIPPLLRVWEPRTHFVVLGYGNRLRDSVRVAACRRLQIPILRRLSGGGTVLQGPGCLNFSLILGHNGAGPLAGARATTRFVLERHRDALAALLGPGVSVEGISDLALARRKFSGNAQRRMRRAVLFHGTFLLSLDLRLVERVLCVPVDAPVYRRRRTHEAFLTNVRVSASRLKEALRACWKATRPLERWPREEIDRLVRARYGTPDWTLRR